MPTVNPYNKMMDNVVLTASKEELTLMLYEGGIKFCNQAIAAIEKNEMETAHTCIIRVEDIIREFQITLDHSYEISKNLDAMYDYMHRRMSEANSTKDAEIIKEVRDFFREFRDTWKEAIKLSRQ